MTDPYLVTNPRGIAYRLRLDLNDYTIFNRDELLKFLVDHQGQEIDIEVPEGSCLNSIGLYKILDLFQFPIVTIRSNNIVEQLPSTRYRLNKHIQSFQYFDVPGMLVFIAGMVKKFLVPCTTDRPGPELALPGTYFQSTRIRHL